MIRADSLAVRIGRALLLDGVDLTVAPGRFTAVIGPNGAGKSTLLRCLAGEIAPASGRVTLDGTLIASWDLVALARRRAVLPQQVTLDFPLTVREVVTLGRGPHRGVADAAADRRAVDAALDAADVAVLADRSYPSLSGGEQQRVQFARALAQLGGGAAAAAPTYLLLDEPTASLDLAHQSAVLRVARGLADAGTGVLAILHDLNQAARFADEIVLLRRGRVFAAGPPAGVLTAATVEAVFGCPVEIVPHPQSDRPFLVPL
ncbi:heme ABC transporter ATP-binding protein [Inquilinus sp. Marseille-Q2685]|uniref:heme ABC transporter ATP-binding protein n=1 Tax=Inquilinus sp. Marseille-Q2685 TaxID=2866581 RepID=UPI001CE3D617|nr:heme ABC transporter ATP-binding protein [Inquilinus sp. Marseille-Q2685]